ncbi:MAG: hypothetical protein HND52_11390 [Ignavibacteriae bacterium]|nr:hypothetical protein [Ignavibacteriota bacterium]NOG98552.1 hypothetical protein [Ignavibacteriota bacterium]
MKAIVILFLLWTTIIVCQERSGLQIGVQYEMTSHTNPYVFVEGTDQLNPISVKGFEDNTSQVYFPFGYVNYSKKGYSEFSTYAFHMLAVGGMNLLSSNKEYVFTTDKTYSGDSYADGYTPVFDNAGSVGAEYKNFNTNKGLEASFEDLDLVRLVYSGSLNKVIGVPLMLGAQGGLGNFGVHFAKVQPGHETTELNNDHTGLVNFNETVDLYFGANVGYVTEIFEGDLAMLLVQYDWYYFIKGVPDNSFFDGNKLTVELSYFPFDYRRKFLKNLFFKAFYKTSSVPYMKTFAEKFETDYTFSKIGIGVNYLIL